MLSSFSAVFLTSAVALAEGPTALNTDHGGYVAIAIAIGIGLAAFGGAIGQSRTAAAALESIGRNPNAAEKLQVPMIVGLAFIELLVLFTWVLMFMMQGKL